MRRAVLLALAACTIVGGAWKQSGGSNPATALAEIFSERKSARTGTAPGERETWGNPASLPDHFARHGADFHARDADDYARQAWAFGEHAKAGGLLVKVDADGVRRVFDPRTGAFGAYNADGTTKTYFKPNSRDYFDRQPGRLVNRW
jgi:pyocin large subunit-like protein